MSLIPARYNFTIYQEATFYKRVYFKVDEIAQDLSEYSAKLVIKDEPEKTKLLELTSAEGDGIKLGGILGTIDITISAETTSTLTWDDAYYELFVIDESITPDPRVDVLMRGGFKVIPF